MNRQDAESITEQYLKRIYGFAVKRCRTLQDAEDLAQEIAAKLFSALLTNDSIVNIPGFVWRLAHNVLANYYRGRQTSFIGIPMDDIAETAASGESVEEDFLRREAESRLHGEIARLSRLQRHIVVAYYYRNKCQRDIAEELGVPEGTVKWHLFEAKKELRKGMDEMRSAGELKFNPVKLCMIGTNGFPGTMGANNTLLRSALAQNIAYCVKDGWKTVNEIADVMGTSPVYVESEAEFLAEYGFLLKDKDRYFINFLLDEPSEEQFAAEYNMYKRAAESFAPRLFDALRESGILNRRDILCRGSENFAMWSLFPYVAALSGENTAERSIPFEEAMTRRPDGGANICNAEVEDPDIKRPEGAYTMDGWCGPMWNSDGVYTLWQIDSRWSSRHTAYPTESGWILSLLHRMLEGGTLTDEEYARLSEKGYIARGARTMDDISIMVMRTAEAARCAVAIGDEIKDNMRSELNALKEPYVKMIMDKTPEHLKKMRAFEFQYIFDCDGMFLLYCLHSLLESGRLTAPETDAERKALTTLIVSGK